MVSSRVLCLPLPYAPLEPVSTVSVEMTLLCFMFLFMFETQFFTSDQMVGKVNICDISLAKFNAKVQKGYFFDATKIVSKQLCLALAVHDGPKLCTCNLDELSFSVTAFDGFL